MVVQAELLLWAGGAVEIKAYPQLASSPGNSLEI